MGGSKVRWLGLVQNTPPPSPKHCLVPCVEVLLLEASKGLVTQFSWNFAHLLRNFSQLDLTLPDRYPPCITPPQPTPRSPRSNLNKQAVHTEDATLDTGCTRCPTSPHGTSSPNTNPMPPPPLYIHTHNDMHFSENCTTMLGGGPWLQYRQNKVCSINKVLCVVYGFFCIHPKHNPNLHPIRGQCEALGHGLISPQRAQYRTVQNTTKQCRTVQQPTHPKSVANFRRLSDLLC